MLFYILWAITVGLAFWWTISIARRKYDSWGGLWHPFAKVWAVVWRFAVVAVLGPFVAGFIALIVAFVAHGLGGSEERVVQTDRADLQALSVGSDINGQFFLGTGYVNGELTFNYIVDEGDYSTLNQVSASKASVWEDEPNDPYLDYTKWGYYVDWAIPMGVTSVERFDFHIPEGSVSGNYEVSP